MGGNEIECVRATWLPYDLEIRNQQYIQRPYPSIPAQRHGTYMLRLFAAVLVWEVWTPFRPLA